MNNRQRTHARIRQHAVKTAAVALMGSALLFGASAPFAFAADAAAPVVSTVNAASDAVHMTFRSVQQTTGQLETDLQIPVISGMKDTAYQNTLNANLAARAKANADAIAKQSADDYASDDGSYPFRAYGITIRGELLSDGSAAAGGVLSFRVYTYTFTGGAHGMTIVETYNIRNEKTASPIKLKDLFGPNYKTVVNRAVTAEIAYRPNDFYPDSPFKTIADNQAFYIRNGVAYIVFQQYDVAPYAAGMPEFALAIPGFGGSVPANADDLPVVAGGKAIPGVRLYTAPGNVLMAPLRPIAEALGYKLTYVASTHKTFVSKSGKTSFVVLGKNRYAAGEGASFTLGSAPVSLGGTLYVPVEFFKTAFGEGISYSKQAITFAAASPDKSSAAASSIPS